MQQFCSETEVPKQTTNIGILSLSVMNSIYEGE